VIFSDIAENGARDLPAIPQRLPRARLHTARSALSFAVAAAVRREQGFSNIVTASNPISAYSAPSPGARTPRSKSLRSETFNGFSRELDVTQGVGAEREHQVTFDPNADGLTCAAQRGVRNAFW
jgi:hypothetical protein